MIQLFADHHRYNKRRKKDNEGRIKPFSSSILSLDDCIERMSGQLPATDEAIKPELEGIDSSPQWQTAAHWH
jgi:hypothetical protein